MAALHSDHATALWNPACRCAHAGYERGGYALQFDRHREAADQPGQFVEMILVRRVIPDVIRDHGLKPNQAFVVADRGQGGGVIAVKG